MKKIFVQKEIAYDSGNTCLHPWFDVWINAAGKVHCCPQNRAVMGNIIEEDFRNIWNSDASRNLRDLAARGLYEKAGCDKECPFLRNSFSPPSEQPPADELINPLFDMAKDGSFYARNLSIIVDDFRQRDTELHGFPLFVDIQPSVSCNSDCIMCGQPHSEGTILPQDVFEKLSVLKPYANYFRWQGGEVFLLKGFTDYLVKFDDPSLPNLHRYIITNGSMLDAETVYKLTYGERPVHFLISMDGVTRETYNRVRKNLEFDKVMSAIKLLAEVQRKKEIFNLVRWNYVVMKSTMGEMKQAIDLADELSVDLNFAPVQGTFRHENIFLYPDIVSFDLFDYFSELNEYSKNKSVHISGFVGMKYRLENVLVEKV